MESLTLEQAERAEEQLGHPIQPPLDTRSEDLVVTSVQVREHRWDIEYDKGGFSILVDDLPWPKKHIKPPEIGDRMRVYMHNGWNTVGFDLRGERLFLRSEREMHLLWLLFRARKLREEARNAQI